MLPTAFRTYTLPAQGTEAIRIVGAAPYPQRVQLDSVARGAAVPPFPGTPLIAYSSNELTIPDATPAWAVSIFEQFVVAADQALYAAADLSGGAAPVGLAVSVSADIPFGTEKAHISAESAATYRSFVLPVVGTPTIRVAAATPYPQRVVVASEVINATLLPDVFIRLTSSANNLTLPPNVAFASPSGAYGYRGGVRVFVLAPEQPLYASIDPGFGGPFVLSVSSQELCPQDPRGATGIPSPDGQE